MKKTLCFLLLVLLGLSVFGQTKTGTLKIFTEVNSIVLYLDDVKQDEGTKTVNGVPVGTHYLKALSNGTAIYSEIIEIKNDEVTTVLIKNLSNKVDEKPVVKPVENTGVVTFNSNPITPLTNETNSHVSKEELKSVPLINIGQINGTLPADMGAPYGLTFGMALNQVNDIMTPKAAQTAQYRGFSNYAMYTANESSLFLVECRFIDNKLFTVIIGYPTLIVNKDKVKLDKTNVPTVEFENMYADLLTIYGEPTKVTKKYIDGYAENDGKLIEALKKRKALILYEWIHPETGNSINLTVAYTTAPVAAVIYLSGLLGKEAQTRSLKINGVTYTTNTYEYDYFNK